TGTCAAITRPAASDRSAVRTGAAPDQLALAVDLVDADHLARIADVRQLRIIRIDLAAGAGFAPERGFQRADHQLAGAGQRDEDFAHALLAPGAQAGFAAQLVDHLVAADFEAGLVGLETDPAAALARGTARGAGVGGGEILAGHARRLAPGVAGAPAGGRRTRRGLRCAGRGAGPARDRGGIGGDVGFGRQRLGGERRRGGAQARG